MGAKLQLCKISKFQRSAYNTTPVVDNKVLCTLKFVKRVDFMLSGSDHKK